MVGDGREVIWFSQRDGWGHLYLYDGASGRLKHPITTGEWLVRDLLRVDEAVTVNGAWQPTTSDSRNE